MYGFRGCQRAVARLLPHCERRVNWRIDGHEESDDGDVTTIGDTTTVWRMPRRLVLSAAVAASSLVAVGGGSSSVVDAAPPGFTDTVVTDVGTLTAVEALPDGRVVALEKSGRMLRIDDRDGSADVTTLANFAVCSNSERGLLGFATDPAYVTSGFVYVYRTIFSGEPGGCHNRVSRFFMNENGLDLGSERVLVDRISSVAGNHNGGDVEIGNDGYLYIAVGDAGRDPRGDSGGAGSNDAAQDNSLLNGKILRVQRDSGFAAPGNPFGGAGTADCRVRGNSSATPTSACREIFAFGLRNPYRFAFDPNTSDTRFLINDVGQGDREEVNEGQIGANYGWPTREGRCPQGQNPPCAGPGAGLTDPVTDYGHGDGLFITGGAFVPDGAWPEQFDGAYLVSDGAFGTTWAWQGETDLASAFEFLDASAPTDMVFVTGPQAPELWYVQQNGEVHKVAPPLDDQAADSGPQRYGALGTPVRSFDSRALSPAAPLRAGQTRLIDLDAPSGATAAFVNLTLVQPQSDAANATAWQPRTSRPATSNVNAPAGANVANASIVPLDADGQLMVFMQATGHLVVDVSGFFFDEDDAVSEGRFQTDGNAFLDFSPGRLVDTRNEADESNDYVRVLDGAGERVTVPIYNPFVIPGGLRLVSAASVVVTAINRDNAVPGFVTAYPEGSDRPTASNVNVNAAPDVRANLVTVPVGPDGSIELYIENIDDVAVDFVGWFTGVDSDLVTDGRFHLSPPTREADSRFGIGFDRLSAGSTAALNPSSAPDSASAVAQNLTIVRTGGRGFVTAYPGSADRPNASNVNSSGPNQTRAALALTSLESGTEQLFAGDVDTDLIVDVFGWFE